jgi:hypothetical protein
MTVPDIATESHPPQIRISPPLLVEWAKFPAFSDDGRAARIEYVQRELERAVEAGVSPLYAALVQPLEAQQSDCFAALKAMGLDMVYLRLVAGVETPACDSQGRALMREDAGKLVVKTGNVPFKSAALRDQASKRGQEIYKYARIGAKPVPMPLDEAISVMRRWGYGIRFKRAQRPNEGPRRDEWLVVHVQPDGSPFGKSESQEPAPSRGRARAESAT